MQWQELKKKLEKKESAEEKKLNELEKEIEQAQREAEELPAIQLNVPEMKSIPEKEKNYYSTRAIQPLSAEAFRAKLIHELPSLENDLKELDEREEKLAEARLEKESAELIGQVLDAFEIEKLLRRKQKEKKLRHETKRNARLMAEKIEAEKIFHQIKHEEKENEKKKFEKELENDFLNENKIEAKKESEKNEIMENKKAENKNNEAVQNQPLNENKLPENNNLDWLKKKLKEFK